MKDMVVRDRCVVGGFAVMSVIRITGCDVMSGLSLSAQLEVKSWHLRDFDCWPSYTAYSSVGFVFLPLWNFSTVKTKPTEEYAVYEGQQ